MRFAALITRINAAARQHGLSYSQLIAQLKKANIELNRTLAQNGSSRSNVASAKSLNWQPL